MRHRTISDFITLDGIC